MTVKLGSTGPTVMGTCTFWLRVPEVAAMEIAPFPAAAVAVTVICCATPGVRVTVAGLADSPLTPERFAITVPLNPLIAVASRPKVPVPPAGTVKLEGALRVKFGWLTTFNKT